MEIAIIGGGPAGLRAAGVAAAGGAEVTVFDAKASVGRKFLVAGGGGLNLTKDEPVERFAARYRGTEMPGDFWRQRIAEFGPAELREWVAGLGIETFAASTGRIYPHEMKAAPLLRRWVQSLRAAGVRFAMHHRWLGWEGDSLRFATPDGIRDYEFDAVILALGGGSWPDTGSDGSWVDALEARGVEISTLQPANCGWEAAWPESMRSDAGGLPVKNIVARAGGEMAAGELLITQYGLEGGAIYQLGAALRAMERPEIEIDLKPALTAGKLVAKLGLIRGEFLREARVRWRLSDGAFAMLSNHPDMAAWNSAEALAHATKNLKVELLRPRPLTEAISTAGGVRWRELDERLMINRLPGVFVAGEMIDWEAPTGGYLIHGCLATGAHAARGALAWISR